MSSKGDISKDMAYTAGATLLSQYLDSAEVQFNMLRGYLSETKDRTEDFIDLTIEDKHTLKKMLTKLRPVLMLVADNIRAGRYLLQCIKDLRAQLNEFYEVPEYTQFCVAELENALDEAILSTYNIKANIQNGALLVIQQNTGGVRQKSLIPKPYFKLVEQLGKETEED